LIAAGLPLFLALIGTEGATGAFLAHEVQRQHQEMEGHIRGMDDRFAKFMSAMAEDCRTRIEGIQYPFEKDQASSTVNSMCLKNYLSMCEIISSEGALLLHRDRFPGLPTDYPDGHLEKEREYSMNFVETDISFSRMNLKCWPSTIPIRLLFL